MLKFWEYRQIPFRFMLGDKTLFAPRLSLQVRELQLADGEAPVAEPALPDVFREPGSEGFLTRSLPITQSQPSFRWKADYICYVSAQYARYYIDLGSSFDDYQKKFSSKTCATIKRKVKKYAQYCNGRVDWKAYRDLVEMREFFSLARQVSAKTYQERILDAGIPDSDAFVREMEALARDGLARGYILFDDARPVAYLYCPIRDGALLYRYLGYDPEYARWSPGTILLWRALESMFQEGIFRMFDFMEGETHNKRLFGTHSVQCATVYFLRNTLRNAFLVRAHHVVATFSRFSGEVLDHLGVKSRIRRWVRFGSGNRRAEDF